jgi:hypothetical protein
VRPRGPTPRRGAFQRPRLAAGFAGGAIGALTATFDLVLRAFGAALLAFARGLEVAAIPFQ